MKRQDFIKFRNYMLNWEGISADEMEDVLNIIKIDD